MVRVFKIADGYPLQHTLNADGWVRSVKFDPNGRLLAVGADDVELWDLVSGERKHVLKQDYPYYDPGSTEFRDKGTVYDITFSPDAKLVASANTGNRYYVWNIVSGEEVREVSTSGLLFSVDFSPDGSKFAYASGDQVLVLDFATGEAIHRFQHRQFQVIGCCRFSPDGSTLVSTTGSQVCLWNMETGRLIWTWEAGEGVSIEWTGAADFSPSGQFLAVPSHHRNASGNGQNLVQIITASSGATIDMLEGDTFEIKRVRFSPNGRLLASTSGNGVLRFWEVGGYSDLLDP